MEFVISIKIDESKKKPNCKYIILNQIKEMASSLVVPKFSTYFRCVIDLENSIIPPKISTITYKIFLQNESIRKGLKLKLKRSMEINLQNKIEKLSNSIRVDCKNLKKNYKTVFNISSEKGAGMTQGLSHPDKLWKVMEKDYHPFFCNMAKNSSMRQALDSHLSKWANREKWTEENYVNLLQTFRDAEKKLVGREEIIDEMFAIVLTFAYNPYYVVNSNLNFALLGKKGSGKTTIAKILQDILIHSGILLGEFDKTPHSVSKENLLGDTALKTKEKTLSILEAGKEHVIIIDDADMLPSSPLWKQYGKVILQTILDFLKNNKGSIAILVAGDTTTTMRSFFGVYKDLTKCFPFMFILREYTKQNLIDILKMELKNVYSIQKGAIKPNAFEYLNMLLNHDGYVVEQKQLPQGKKISSKKLMSYKLFFFPNSAKDIQQFAAYMAKYILSNASEEKSFDTKQMEQVLKLYLFQTKKRKIHGSFPNMEELNKSDEEIHTITFSS